MFAPVSSGLHLRISPLNITDFGNVKNSSALSLILALHIEAHTFTVADFVVRSHAGTNLGGGGGGNVVFDLLADGNDFADPSTSFLGGTVLPAPITLGAAGSYQLATSSKPFGRFLAVKLTATQSAGGGALVAAYSIDVTLKSGDGSALMNAPNSFPGYRIG